MEYLVGSFSTIITILVILLIINKLKDRQPKVAKIFYSQSNIYERIKPAIPYMPLPPRESQSINHRKKQMVRIVMTEGKAYWIMDNRVLEAPISPEGIVEYSSAIPIDTMGLSKIELDRLSFIVEKLTEGNEDDSSNSRY